MRQRVDVTPGMKEPLRIRLPAASVVVDFHHPTEDAKQMGVLLMAVDEDGRSIRQEFTGYSDSTYGATSHDRPCLDFIPPGRYTLRAWRDGFGWAKSGLVDVEAGKIANAGTLKFQPGGTVKGRVEFSEMVTVVDGVAAVDPNGISIPAETKWTPEGYTFVVEDLWPGKWTVSVLDRDRNVVIEKRAELQGTETVEIKSW